MLMLTILHIFLIANGRTLHSIAQAIKDRLMLSWVTSCVCTTLVRSLVVVLRVLLPPVGSIMDFLLMQRMETLRDSVERLLGKLFSHPFSKCYFLCLTLVIIDFEITETISFGE
jgi:hypothetical protein